MTKKKPLSRKRLSVTCTKGVLTIQIGLGALEKVCMHHPELTAFDDVTGDYIFPSITNARVFGMELVRVLRDEEEDGTTPVHQMLDAAIVAACEQGAEGILTGQDKAHRLIRDREDA